MSKSVALLNQLLEAEKAGVMTLDFFKQEYPDVALPFNDIKEDETWSVAGLIASIKRENGNLSTTTGDFLDKIKAQDSLANQLELLNKGQEWVARKIDDLLVMDLHQETQEFLELMKEKHLENIRVCEDYLNNLSKPS